MDEIETLLKEATTQAAGKLRELAEDGPDKETRKAARRALYRLSQTGIEPIETVNKRPAEAVDTLKVYASAFDGAGNRLFFFVLPDPDGGWPTLAQILVNDMTGVQNFETGKMSGQEAGKRIDVYLDQLDAGLAMAEIEADYGRWLVQQARGINQRLVRPTPFGFADWMRRIGASRQEYDTSPVYACLDPDTVAAAPPVPHDTDSLFALSWFEPWFFAAEETIPWLERWEQSADADTSEAEETVRERQESILDEATEALMTPQMRVCYQTRLEESADILRRRGKIEAARQALFHAESLADNRPVSEIAFARAVVRRTIEGALEMLARAKQEN